jgi:hypothetical protein
MLHAFTSPVKPFADVSTRAFVNGIKTKLKTKIVQTTAATTRNPFIEQNLSSPFGLTNY